MTNDIEMQDDGLETVAMVVVPITLKVSAWGGTKDARDKIVARMVREVQSGATTNANGVENKVGWSVRVVHK